MNAAARQTIRRLAPDEIKQHQERLERSQTPAEMERNWRSLNATLGAFKHLQSGLQFVRDAFVAFKFAQANGAEVVWLLPPPRPDFGVTFKDQRTVFYEVTERDLPGRKRGDLYKTIIPERLAGTEKAQIDEDMLALCSMEPEVAFELLNSAASDKAKTDLYEKTWGLVIRLNPSSDEDDIEAIVAGMASATAGAKDAFCEVWVLFDGAFYLVWRDGQQQSIRTPHVSS
jgi:hypothetical protein